MYVQCLSIYHKFRHLRKIVWNLPIYIIPRKSRDGLSQLRFNYYDSGFSKIIFIFIKSSFVATSDFYERNNRSLIIFLTIYFEFSLPPLVSTSFCRVSRSIFTFPASHMILSSTDASSSSYHNLFQPVKYLLYTVLSIRDIFSLLSAVMLFRHSYSI